MTTSTHRVRELTPKTRLQLGKRQETGNCGPELGRLELEDDTGRDSASEHVVDGLVDLVNLAVDGDHLGAPGGVKGEDVGEVVTGADDRADDSLAVDDGVEDRQTQRRIVSGQRHAH